MYTHTQQRALSRHAETNENHIDAHLISLTAHLNATIIISRVVVVLICCMHVNIEPSQTFHSFLCCCCSCHTAVDGVAIDRKLHKKADDTGGLGSRIQWEEHDREERREKELHGAHFCTHYQTHISETAKRLMPIFVADPWEWASIRGGELCAENISASSWLSKEWEIMAIVCNVMKKTCSKPITAFVFQPANRQHSERTEQKANVISIIWYLFEAGNVCELLNGLTNGMKHTERVYGEREIYVENIHRTSKQSSVECMAERHGATIQSALSCSRQLKVGWPGQAEREGDFFHNQ